MYIQWIRVFHENGEKTENEEKREDEEIPEEVATETGTEDVEEPETGREEDARHTIRRLLYRVARKPHRAYNTGLRGSPTALTIQGCPDGTSGPTIPRLVSPFVLPSTHPETSH